MALDFNTWAVVAPNNETGFGRMAQDAQAVLGIRTHLVATPHHLDNAPICTPHAYALPKHLDEGEVTHLLASIQPALQGVLMFEYLEWNPHLIPVCKKLGIKTVCVITWEWFSGKNPLWGQCDLIVCPCLMAEKVVKQYGWSHFVHLPWALDLSKFPKCRPQQQALVFGHNAGVVDQQDRKGTRDTLRAFLKTRNPCIRLKIRSINGFDYPPFRDDRVIIEQGALPEPAKVWQGIDVAVQPSKMEGIGFMVIEALCSGLPVITLDYPPMNEFVHQACMRVRPRWLKYKAIPSAWHPQAHLKLPDTSQLADAITWCSTHDLQSIAEYNRSFAEYVFDKERLQSHWHQTLDTQLF
jgi:glycosyltransferase involved in cell wall biosynthesis